MFKTLDQFDAFVERDTAALKKGLAPAGLCKCERCQVPLQESVTGFRRLAKEPACSDCYYAEAGELMATSPVPGKRGVRGE